MSCYGGLNAENMADGNRHWVIEAVEPEHVIASRFEPGEVLFGTFLISNLDGSRAPCSFLHVQKDGALSMISKQKAEETHVPFDAFLFKIRPLEKDSDPKLAFAIYNKGRRVQPNSEDEGLELEGDPPCKDKPAGWNDFYVETFGKLDSCGRQMYSIHNKRSFLHIKGNGMVSFYGPMSDDNRADGNRRWIIRDFFKI